MRPVLASLTAIAAALTLAACETTTTPVETATPPVAASPADYTQLMDDLRILSADDMDGRGIGTGGGERARTVRIVGGVDDDGRCCLEIGTE